MKTIAEDNRDLHNRSKLSFHYDKGGGNISISRLPFFENIKVDESKSARWKKYNVVSRSSDLYAYLGADSRKLSLSFSMTLPHIQSLIDDVGWTNYKDLQIEDPKEEFSKTPPDPTDTPDSPSFLDSAKAVNDETDSFSLLDLSITALSSLADSAKNLLEKDLVYTVMFWVNTIRTCVSNNAKDPSLGPPIIRLTHGVMFQDVPCIATSVNITSDPLAGYDKRTLLPRKIDVTMSLEEFRMGDLGDYAAGEATTRDNLAGWEAVIKTGSTDPRGLK